MQMVKPKMIKHVVDGINLLEFTRDAILNEGKNNKLVKKKKKKILQYQVSPTSPYRKRYKFIAAPNKQQTRITNMG